LLIVTAHATRGAVFLRIVILAVLCAVPLVQRYCIPYIVVVTVARGGAGGRSRRTGRACVEPMSRPIAQGHNLGRRKVVAKCTRHASIATANVRASEGQTTAGIGGDKCAQRRRCQAHAQERHGRRKSWRDGEVVAREREGDDRWRGAHGHSARVVRQHQARAGGDECVHQRARLVRHMHGVERRAIIGL
jgi:hypothetical protein